MSALPPKADIVERDRHVCFVPKADILRLRLALLDHLLDGGEQRRRNGEAERLGRLRLSDKLIVSM
jgi:hypothetical protein